MRHRLSVSLLSVVSALALVAACKKDDPPAQTPAGQPGYPQQGAYPQQQGAYPQQQGAYPQQPYPQQGAYPQQPYPQQTTGTPAATTPATGVTPTTGGAMSTPGPLAFPCTSDATCGTHHCNTAAGKCAFPCQTDADCITNTSCLVGAGICAMKAPGQ